MQELEKHRWYLLGLSFPLQQKGSGLRKYMSFLKNGMWPPTCPEVAGVQETCERSPLYAQIFT